MTESDITQDVDTSPDQDVSVDAETRSDRVRAHVRLVGYIVVHNAIFALSLLLAFLLWFDANQKMVGSNNYINWGQKCLQYLAVLPFFLIVKTLIFGMKKLFRGGWQYAGIRDVISILVASWLFVLVAAGAMFIIPWSTQHFRAPVLVAIADYFGTFPKGVLPLDFLGTVFFVCTARLWFRIYRQERRPISPDGLRRVLIIGAGNAAETIIREIDRMSVEKYRVIGLVDDDPAKRKIIMHGAPVLGTTDEIADLCEDFDIDEILIAITSASRKDMQRIIDLCGDTNLKFSALPAVSDLIDGKITVSQMRPVDIEDLLGRDVVQLDDDAIGKFLSGRRILITGAGGSIGSEMCRQICKYTPNQLILVEQAETPLFDIDNELRKKHPEISIAARICDIFDRDRVMELWDQHRPEVVIHAAAHKHVPLMEHNPCEAIKNNILGTRNVADASCKFDTDEFVMISTDKAVNPSSVMGASKRVAEIYTQALNGTDNCRTQFKAVRFGNVLGSAGSVIPTFRRQIAEGGPVCVTHPDMTRYFMTIPEASRLVLQAASTGTGGQIYLLDMGESVKIVDLAKQMITLSGFVPDKEIEIKFIGVRPGEKLYEELRSTGEDLEPTVHPKVNIWKSCKGDWKLIQEMFTKFEKLQNCFDRAPVVALLQEMIPEYKPLNPPKANSMPTAKPAKEA